MNNFNIDFAHIKACVYRGEIGRFGGYLQPITELDDTTLETFIGLNETIATLKTNTNNFIHNRPSSHVLFWGARGCGKTSSMRAVLCHLLREKTNNLRVIEIDKQDLAVLPFILDFIRTLPFKFIIFCDDLSFAADDDSYKPLKRILDGGFEKAAANVRFYATSNLRHLLLEEYAQNTAHILHEHDRIDEIMSLSERFGISIGFYTLSSDEYLSLIATTMRQDEQWKQHALNYATLKGSRNARIAKEFIKLYQSGLYFNL